MFDVVLELFGLATCTGKNIRAGCVDELARDVAVAAFYAKGEGRNKVMKSKLNEKVSTCCQFHDSFWAS